MSKQMISFEGTLHISFGKEKRNNTMLFNSMGTCKRSAGYHQHASRITNQTAPVTLYHLKKKKKFISVHVLRHLVTLEAFFFSNKFLKRPKLHLVLYHLSVRIKKVTFSLKV